MPHTTAAEKSGSLRRQSEEGGMHTQPAAKEHHKDAQSKAPGRPSRCPSQWSGEGWERVVGKRNGEGSGKGRIGVGGGGEEECERVKRGKERTCR